MVQTPTQPETETLLLGLPKNLKLYVTQEQFAVLGWLIDPKNRKVEVYRLGSEVEVLSNPNKLSGEEVLPGFRLNLRRVWG